MSLRSSLIIALALPCATLAAQQTAPTPPATPVPATPPIAPAPSITPGMGPVAPLAPIAPFSPDILWSGTAPMAFSQGWPDQFDLSASTDALERANEQLRSLHLDQLTADAQDRIADARDRAAEAADRASQLASLDQLSALQIFPGAGFGGSMNGGPRAPWIQGDPADSTYRKGREAINRGDWGPAAKAFNECSANYPKSRYVADCGYWEAYARYRLGTLDELKKAEAVIQTVSAHASDVSKQTDVAGLRTRIYSALAMRGDANAADELRKDAAQGGKACDLEDMSVQAQAMSALNQMDPDQAFPTVRRVLDRRDECSVDLRKSAIQIVARRNDTTAAALLVQVAKRDTSKEVRESAISYLGRMSGNAAYNGLDDLVRTTTDDDIQNALISALASSSDPRAHQALRTMIDKNPPEKTYIRLIRAIGARGQSAVLGCYATPGNTSYMDMCADRAVSLAEAKTHLNATAGKARPTAAASRATTAAEDDAFLRGLFPKAKSDAVKSAIVSSLSPDSSADNQQFLIGIAGNSSETSAIRAVALSKLGRMSISIANLSKLYDAADSRAMREELISVFSSRKEPEATDKLIDIVKTGTDPELKKEAINGLMRKNDPRATKMLLDLIKTS